MERELQFSNFNKWEMKNGFHVNGVELYSKWLHSPHTTSTPRHFRNARTYRKRKITQKRRRNGRCLDHYNRLRKTPLL